MIYLIFIPILTAIVIYLSKNTKVTIYATAINLIEIVVIAYLIKNVMESGTQNIIIGGWSKIVGISLYLDLVNAILLLVTSVLWLITITYSLIRWKKDFKFYFFLYFLRGTFYGLILSNDLFNMFIFVEIISLISAILIIYKKDGYSLRAGIYYLLFNSIGMIFYLLGIVIIYTNTGTMNIESLMTVEMNETLKMGIALVIASAGVKSAFFPVYNWLPKAHTAAPSAMSALLSGILVKTGFIILIKMTRYIDYTMYYEFLTAVGIATGILGFIFAMSQKDIKSILAFHTVSQSGLILIGLAGGLTLQMGGFLHLINHAFFKSLLFLTVGLIINKYNIRRVDKIRGVLKKMPIISILLIIGMLSITGCPYTNGYVSKFIIKSYYKDNLLMMMIMHILNLGTIISFIKMSQIFFGSTRNKEIKESFKENISIIVLGVITLTVGLFEMYILNENIDIHVYVRFKDFVIYGIYLIIGYGFYYKFLKKEAKVFYKIRHTHLNFRDANALLLMFVILSIIFIG
jgi:multicomponent Na+:H+ antiporter subunit D